MTIGRIKKTDTELDDDSVAAYIRAFVAVQAADWRKRQVNALLPDVLQQVDAARARGKQPDMHAILRKIWTDHAGPAGLLD